MIALTFILYMEKKMKTTLLALAVLFAAAAPAFAEKPATETEKPAETPAAVEEAEKPAKN